MKSTPKAALLALAIAGGLASSAIAADCEGAPGESVLAVHVSGVKASKGEVAVTIYPDDAKRFLASGAKVARLRPRASAPETLACFSLPAGYYAIAVYHDADGDRDFDRTIVGLPKEGYGFSNDAPTKTGLPSFKSVRFRVGPGETSMPIKMRYP